MPGIIIDIGTGDGTFTYELARANPDRFIIGIDPNHGELVDASNRIYKKPQKGGLKNALFVLANVRDLPTELDGLANQVFLNFPWGSLLHDVVNAEPNTWKAIKRVCMPGAFVDVLLGYDEHDDRTVTHDLPPLNESYIHTALIPALENLGFAIVKITKVSAKDIRHYPSSWAKRLGYGSDKQFYYLRLQATLV